MTPSHAAVLAAAALAVLTACAPTQEQEAAAPPPAVLETQAAVTDYQRCVAACALETPGQRPLTPRTARGVTGRDRSFADQTRMQEVDPLRAAQAQCLSECEALQAPTN
jgi:hypothetical protein